jgi:hypothetical protein
MYLWRNRFIFFEGVILLIFMIIFVFKSTCGIFPGNYWLTSCSFVRFNIFSFVCEFIMSIIVVVQDVQDAQDPRNRSF